MKFLSQLGKAGHPVLFTLAVITAFLDGFLYVPPILYGFYRERQGASRKDVHESPSIMTFPMIVLAVLAIVAGYINTPWFGTFLGDWLMEGNPALGTVT